MRPSSRGRCPRALGSEEKPESAAAEKAATDDGFRKLRNTESDLDPDAAEEEDEADDWEKLSKEDELPTFFEAIQPLMRRNQRGAGLSAGVDHLAKKWGLSEDEVIGALKECGFTIPEDEDARPDYVEYDGDLFWVNVNRRGELWINTKEKPRPVFRIVPGTKVEPSAPEAEPAASPESGPGAEQPPAPEERRPANREHPAEKHQGNRNQKPGGPSGGATLPEGPALLAKIRPQMRRNRGGPGGSGSVSFLSRALKCREADLTAAFTALGLTLPVAGGEAPPPLEIDGSLWWLNQDQRGGVWINGKEAKSASEPSETAAPAGESSVSADPSPVAVDPPPVAGDHQATEHPAPVSVPPITNSVFGAVRLLLKETKTGAVAGETGRLAETLGKTPEEFLTVLTGAGLKIPEKSREKPVFVEHAGEIFWLNKNSKDELWLNAKVSKFASAANGESTPENKARRGRGRAPTAATEPTDQVPLGE